MTQKELSYYEDAIGHEDNIIKIITESINLLQDTELVSFMEDEKSKHNDMRQKLMNILEKKANE